MTLTQEGKPLDKRPLATHYQSGPQAQVLQPMLNGRQCFMIISFYGV